MIPAAGEEPAPRHRANPVSIAAGDEPPPYTYGETPMSV